MQDLYIGAWAKAGGKGKAVEECSVFAVNLFIREKLFVGFVTLIIA
jgi:hypothetical protein